MPIIAVGWPLSRLSMSELRAPSSTRATSRTRRNEPSGLARMTMLAELRGVVSRPWVWMLSWNCGSSVIGWAPMRPTAAWTFWP